MRIALQKLHRLTSLGLIKYLVQTERTGQALPDRASGPLLYIPASCMPYHISGYTTRTHEILCALQNAGVDLRVLTRCGYPWDRKDRLCTPKDSFTRVDSVLYAHARWPKNQLPTALFAAVAAVPIARYARQQGVSCIHAASNHVNALPALIAARRLGLPFRYEMRGLWELSRASAQPEFGESYLYRLGLELEGLVAAHADRVYVISEQLGRYAQEHWGLDPKRLCLFPNCVDAEHIKPDPDIPVQSRLIGYAGSLVAYEGLDTLLDAVALLRQQGKAPRVHIFGDGKLRPDLEAQAARLELQDCVRFFGRVQPEEARARLQECALICIPRKPFAVCAIVPPIKLVEAMALGKAVVVPDLPVFRDEAAGAFFFRSGDAGDLARVLEEALQDSARLAALGQAGRERVLNHRQWRHFAEQLQPTSLGGQDA